MSIKIWHNPRCSKSREALKILESHGGAEVFKYLDEEITKENIKELLDMLKVNARDIMRTKEDIYKELNLKEESDEEKLIDAMLNHHKLIERPIIIKDNKAVIGRPPSKVLDLIK